MSKYYYEVKNAKEILSSETGESGGTLQSIMVANTCEQSMWDGRFGWKSIVLSPGSTRALSKLIFKRSKLACSLRTLVRVLNWKKIRSG